MGLFGFVDDILGTDLTGEKGREGAINAQTQATESANQTMKEMYDQQRADLEPWRETGGRYLSQLDQEMSGLTDTFSMSDFVKDPGYQFRMNEANKAIERGAAARGGLMGGGTLKALTRYNQDYASNEYQNAYNRFNADRDQRYNKLSNMAGLGQTATNQLVNAGGNYGMSVANNAIGLGNANAAAHMNASNMQNNLLTQGVSTAAMAFSDERLKTEIEPISKEDLDELRKTIKPYIYKYTSEDYGKGEWVGVMAQDLEKTKLGKSLVVENEDGFKMVDLGKVGSLFLATLAEVK